MRERERESLFTGEIVEIANPASYDGIAERKEPVGD